MPVLWRKRRRPRLKSLLAAGILWLAVFPAILTNTPSGSSQSAFPLPEALDNWNPDNPRLPMDALELLKQGVDQHAAREYAAAIDLLAEKESAPDFLLNDVRLLYRARAYQLLKRYSEALEDFRSLQKRYPDSPHAAEAVMGQCRTLLEMNEPQSILALLDSAGKPATTEALYHRARALHLTGERKSAADLYLRIHTEDPTSQYAAPSESHLKALDPGALLGRRNYRNRLLRAGKLILAGRRAEARTLLIALGRASAPDTTASQKRRLLLAEADYGMNRTESALISLRAITAADPSMHARALYLEGACRRRQKNDALFLALRDKALKRYPTSPDTEELCYSVATYYDVNNNTAAAEQAYRVLLSAFPKGRHAERARWKLAIQSYLNGKPEQAAREFWDYARAYPDPLSTGPALYWIGRCYRDLGDSPKALFLFAKTADLIRNSFYGERARAELPALAETDTQVAVLDFTQVTAFCDKLGYTPNPLAAPDAAGMKTLRRAEQLAAAHLEDLALAELRYGIRSQPRNKRLHYYLSARVSARRQDYHGAISSLRNTFPDYAGRSFEELPAEAWQLFYPMRHLEIISQQAAKGNIDPALLLGLIRQESAFKETARSRANARGLMQILPSTGAGLARRAGLRGFTSAKLYEPETNIMLGTRFLADLVTRYGREDFALAAYNAGESRVKRWQEAFGQVDMALFVEQIPFRETRNYVKLVLGNKSRYRSLIGTPSGSSAWKAQ